MASTRKRTAGSGTIIARPNGTFTAQVSDPERGRRSIGTFQTRVDAERAIATAIVEGPPPAIDTSLRDYLLAWLADQELDVPQRAAGRRRVPFLDLVRPAARLAARGRRSRRRADHRGERAVG